MKLYKVYWNDISNFTNEKIEKPYKQYTCPSWTIGYIKKDKDTVLVINAGNKDGEECGDAIPRGCITKIEKL